MKSKIVLAAAVFLSSFLHTDKNSSKEITYNPYLTKEEQFELIHSFDSIINNIKYEEDSISIERKTYFDFLDFRFKTMLDTIRDYWQSPKETIKRGKGDCEDKAILLNHLLNKKGLETKLFSGKVGLSSKIYHAWQEFNAGDENYIIESSNSIKIYNRDSLENNKEYIKIEVEKIADRIKEYEKRNGVNLNFNNYD